jgi:hypothetical protein
VFFAPTKQASFLKVAREPGCIPRRREAAVSSLALRTLAGRDVLPYMRASGKVPASTEGFFA